MILTDSIKTETGAARLQFVFMPHFWGSHETRHEKGKTHLVPLDARGEERNRTLCGHQHDAEDSETDFSYLEPGQPIPTHLCKKCQAGARKRGYGK